MDGAQLLWQVRWPGRLLGVVTGQDSTLIYLIAIRLSTNRQLPAAHAPSLKSGHGG